MFIARVIQVGFLFCCIQRICLSHDLRVCMCVCVSVAGLVCWDGTLGTGAVLWLHMGTGAVVPVGGRQPSLVSSGTWEWVPLVPPVHPRTS